MSTTAIGRPIGVSVIAIIAFIQGTIAILAGIGLLVERNNDSLLAHIGRGSDSVTSYGIGGLIWGVLILLVGYGLWKGANWGRIAVAILELLYLAGGVWLLFAWNGYYLWQGIWQILIALFVLYLLFNPRADEFFEGRRLA